MKINDEIRFKVIVCRLDQLQLDHDAALEQLTAQQKLVNWIDWEMSALWIEKAALERQNGYPLGRLFT
jgi:hypothetical protein